MRRYRFVAGLLTTALLALGAAACSSGGGRAKQDPAVARQLRTQLLTAAELGPQFRIDRSSDNGQTPECIKNAKLKIESLKGGEIARAERDFTVGGDKLLLISETLARLKSTAGVKGEVASVVDGCRNVPFKVRGKTYTAHFKKTSVTAAVPILAYRFTVTVQGRQIGGLLTFATKGKTVMVLSSIRYPPIPVSDFQPILDGALTKIK